MASERGMRGGWVHNVLRGGWISHPMLRASWVFLRYLGVGVQFERCFHQIPPWHM